MGTRAPATQRCSWYAVPSGLEVLHLFENQRSVQARSDTSEPFLRLRAGGGKVKTSEHREPSEMCRHLLRRPGDHRDLQASTNDFNDVPYRYSLFSDRAIASP